MTTRTCNKRQIKVELVQQPLDVSTTFFAQHLGELRFILATLQSVRRVQFCSIFDAFVSLCSRSQNKLKMCSHSPHLSIAVELLRHALSVLVGGQSHAFALDTVNTKTMASSMAVQ